LNVKTGSVIGISGIRRLSRAAAGGHELTPAFVG